MSVHAFQKRGQDGIRHERELMGERQEKAGGTSDLDADLDSCGRIERIKKVCIEPITAARMVRNHEARSPVGGVPRLTITCPP